MTPTPEGATPAQQLIAQVESLRKREPERALEALELGFAVALRGEGDARRGELWRLRAHVLRSLRRARAAALAYRRAERWYARAGDRREQGRCAIGLVDALMYLGRYAQAERAARHGRRLLERAGDRSSLARLLNNEGNLFHRLDLPERALLRYRESRRVLQRAGDPRGAALVGGNIANCLSLLGRLSEARKLYLANRRANLAAGAELDALNDAYNLAYLDFLEHRHEAALEGLAKVEDEARARGYPSIAALAALDRAEIFLRMGAHEEALAEARRSIDACGSIGLQYERAKAETFAALAEFRLGQAAAARARLERTIQWFNAEGNAVWTGESLVGLATVWERDRNPRAAAALLSAARRQFAIAGDHEREGCSLALLARMRLACGERAAARVTVERLRRHAARRASPRLAHLALAAEASLARARGDFTRARALLMRAARESERLAARILDEHWRSTFWGEWGWPHRELAALELGRGRVAEAFEALESGRGRALMGEAAVRRARGAELARPVRDWAAGRLARDRDRSSRSAANAAPLASGTRGAVVALPPSLRHSLDTRPPRAIRAASLQRSLPRDLLLLDYLLNEGALDVIGIARDRLRGRGGLISERRLSQLVNALLFTLRSAAFTSAGARAPAAALDEELVQLASLVLWPGLRLAGGTPRALGVVPVGPLARLPWAALPLPDGRALCEALELVVVPGLRLGLTRLARHSEPDGAPLIVASDAGELGNVEPETRAILAAFPRARVLAGDDATAAHFLALAPRAPWIHFAGHGLFQADAPHESGLRLADRWLLAGELADLRLSARWVTLSACQTARALVRPGEEWFGLSRSLLIAGAGAVVASQWDIEDAAAFRLMSDLYRRLAEGVPLGAALAGAQAGRRSEGAHALDWAGFVMLGGPLAVAGAGVPRRVAQKPGNLQSTTINGARAGMRPSPAGGAKMAGLPSHSNGRRASLYPGAKPAAARLHPPARVEELIADLRRRRELHLASGSRIVSPVSVMDSNRNLYGRSSWSFI